MEDTHRKNWYFNPTPRMVRDKDTVREKSTDSFRTTSPEEWLAQKRQQGQLVKCDIMNAEVSSEFCDNIQRRIKENDVSYLPHETVLKCSQCRRKT